MIGRRWMTRTVLVRVALATVVVLGVMQLAPFRITHPPARSEPPWDSPATRSLAFRACGDCHSNRTTSQWYEQMAPISWWIKGHVDDGRAALNFDNWPAGGLGKGTRAARVVQSGSMPPSYYTWLGLHSTAKLTPAERDQLARGLLATLGPGPSRDDRS